jgi:hypothetical protein
MKLLTKLRFSSSELSFVLNHNISEDTDLVIYHNQYKYQFTDKQSINVQDKPQYHCYKIHSQDEITPRMNNITITTLPLQVWT